MRKKEGITWFGERLKMARKMNMLSLRDLADKLGVSHVFIHNYEKGKELPDTSILIKLAEVLNVEVEFFLRSLKIGKLKFTHPERCNFALKRDLDALMFQTQEWLERYHSIESLYPEFSKTVSVPRYRVNSFFDVEKAADALRGEWKLGFGPIGDIAEILEDRGIKVGVIRGTGHFDGCAFLVEGDNFKDFVIVIKNSISGERKRFAISRELGYFVLDFVQEVFLKRKEMMRRANRFARALLAPAEMVFTDIGKRRKHISIGELHLLKLKYGISMYECIHRLEELEIITPSLARSLREKFSKRGWKEEEPGDQILFQKPVRMERMVLRALAERVITKSKALELLGSDSVVLTLENLKK